MMPSWPGIDPSTPAICPRGLGKSPLQLQIPTDNLPTLRRAIGPSAFRRGRTAHHVPPRTHFRGSIARCPRGPSTPSTPPRLARFATTVKPSLGAPSVARRHRISIIAGTIAPGVYHWLFGTLPRLPHSFRSASGRRRELQTPTPGGLSICNSEPGLGIFGIATAIIELYQMWRAWKEVPDRFQKLLVLLNDVAGKIKFVRSLRFAERELTSHIVRLNMMYNERNTRIRVAKINAKFEAHIGSAENGKVKLLCHLKAWADKETHAEAIQELEAYRGLLSGDINKS
ncbi:hypothetical protein GGTG_07168 [Gaeumannomyces tritici R3-111a-1]|uniref:Uncharacterized protein n=1 Tax=Gaeumannomyces tritici (strain R3-111a-1) TaxID=644352 RepID=J3P0X2_GAET3|nr:hypothetical protein GGTG_07168 [Gaeumannomyces tritici R3-111a-1]EJT77256.1 hypothetical protein GGTG_07168 [Gaeumannomyces tritici R3-111a-1]